MALVFLPAMDIANVATELQQRYESDEAVQAFHAYFGSSWMDGCFPIALWNQYDVSANCRTNNMVESWHSLFNRTLRMCHPNLFFFIEFLQ